jgi:hypothetical protein
MCRVMRTAVAAVVALAIAALPLILDRCAESCEAHPPVFASTPACHHATAAGAHIAKVPSPCGHDHNGATVRAAKVTAPAGRAFDAAIAAVSLSTRISPMAADFRLPPHSPPNSSATRSSRSLPLRV